MTDDIPNTRTRRTVLKALGVATATGLAGCSGGGGSAAQQGTGAGDESTSGGSGNGGGGSGDKLIMWNAGFQGDENKPWKDWYVDQFSGEYGRSIQVSAFEYPDARQKFLTGGRTGNPDVIEGVLSHLSEYAKAGLIEPVGDRAEQLDHFDGYVDSTIEAMTYKGELYGLPYTGNGRALVYRKDIFDELGLEPPETAEQFLEAGRTINEERDDVEAFHNCTKDGSVRAFQEWISHVYQHEDRLYEPDGDSWTLVPDAETLGLVFDNFYYQVWAGDDPIGNPEQRGTGWQVNDPGYLNGQFAMIECGPWLRGWTSGSDINDSEKTTTILDEKTAIAHLPRAEGGSKGTYLEVKPVMLNANSKQKEMGWNALSLFTSPASLEEGKKVSAGDYITPVHEDVETSLDNENWTPFTEVFETGKALSKIGWGPVREAFYTHMQNVVYGKSDPYKAGEQFHGELKDLESKV
ncbi:extracellular solute-binding protein [Halogeometricum limi]|uniref:ABC-type glycerol-3-phosphate transport system, substrate-binding protein n=1 Tax=Halogeometricum limi TaxID=555875 RepID=A0A1I6IDK8_9EURY|nr:extracellular solute-binding protein [Halogeometricum limi]SFR64776.1 ABC-type glycerol-3-phosphate transport system, substrate-binding protein [Halogeometricum limi]